MAYYMTVIQTDVRLNPNTDTLGKMFSHSTATYH